MEKYIVNQQIYGLIPSITLKQGDVIELRPEDAFEYVQSGVLSVSVAPKIKTKEEKKTAK